MQLNQLLTLALPIIAMLASQTIQQNHFPEWVNLLIAATSIVAASSLTLVIQGKLTGNVYGDILLVAAASTALQTDGIAPLQQYLRDHLLNLTPAPVNSNPVRIPTPITLPPGSAPVPPRASQQSPTDTPPSAG